MKQPCQLAFLLKNTKLQNTDRPFFSKFNSNSACFHSESELFQSILLEIKNILESRLKLTDADIAIYGDDLPFFYGIRDLQSIDLSSGWMQKFKIHCQTIILKLEPRLQTIDITKIWIDQKQQCINLKITCHLPNKKFSSVLHIKK